MDAVIAACAEAKGVEIAYGDFQAARNTLANERFDCILLSSILHLVQDPLCVLSSFAELLSPRGIVLVSTPNFAQVTTLWRRSRRKSAYRDLGDYDKTGIHLTTARIIRKWFKHCGLAVDRTVYIIPQRGEFVHRLSRGLADVLLGEEIIAVGKRA
jgi:2-polyprenyl-3-methyl-5-hydroxy-6-metoxy-1,4-benzoquinol methylase